MSVIIGIYQAKTKRVGRADDEMCDYRLNPGAWKKELPDSSHSKNREEIPSSTPYREESSLLQICCPKLSHELTKKTQGTKLSTELSQDLQDSL